MSTPAQPDAVPAIAEGPGTRIGPYKLLQEVGQGGFGTVFMAEQEYPVRRRVALKIIKPGMDTRQVVARFEQERQALALMDHPNIAKVLDAGATETGRPYFVMELVRGVSITEYCDAHHLSVRERVELFVPVCSAVQHAHQRGVIHRDIKPSNVMITLHDGKPVPKIIDFGIAKATERRLTEKTLFTELHTMLGTPAYMSPEQAELSGLDVDTRTDVYSLGVLLYELLTGTTPFSKAELNAAGIAGIQRLIREVEPPRPSTRLSTLGASLKNVAANRAAEPARLGLLVRGDLDWIVMKALEKDRNRRYDGASAFADDLRRHLAGDPVVAAPPSFSYRTRKFVTRHRVGMAASTIMLLALIGSLLLMTWSWQKAKDDNARSEAELDRMSLELEARRAAVREAQASLDSIQQQIMDTKQHLAEARAELQSQADESRVAVAGLVAAEKSAGNAEELLHGARASLKPCTFCNGSGKVLMICRSCMGSGRGASAAVKCSECGGKGEFMASCPTCGGDKVLGAK